MPFDLGNAETKQKSLEGHTFIIFSVFRAIPLSLIFSCLHSYQIIISERTLQTTRVQSHTLVGLLCERWQQKVCSSSCWGQHVIKALQNFGKFFCSHQLAAIELDPRKHVRKSVYPLAEGKTPRTDRAYWLFLALQTPPRARDVSHGARQRLRAAFTAQSQGARCSDARSSSPPRTSEQGLVLQNHWRILLAAATKQQWVCARSLSVMQPWIEAARDMLHSDKST